MAVSYVGTAKLIDVGRLAMTSLTDESLAATLQMASETLPEAEVSLASLASLGRLHELRTAPASSLVDRVKVEEVLAAAAGNGRSAVLALFEQRGFELPIDRLLSIAASAGHRNIFQFFHERGHVVFSPELANLVLRNDRATIIRFWLAHDMVERSALISEAIEHDALHCHHMLSNYPVAPSGSSYAMFLKSSRLPKRLDYIVSGRRPAISYDYRTPSASINIDRASLMFLIYRRVMRLVTMGRLRR